MNFNLAPYAAYIWPAYGLSLVLLGGFTLWTLGKWRAAKAKLASLEKK